MAVGSWTNEPYGGSDSRPLAEQWNGRRWSIRPTPNPAGAGATVLRSVSCSSTKACTAVGSSGAGSELAERWNGARWTIQQLPGVGANLMSVSCPSPKLCVAAGADSSGFFKPVVERWNGRAWSLDFTPTPPALRHHRGEDALFALSCPSVSFCMAVGSVDVNGESVTPLAERWNGSQWSLERLTLPPQRVGVPGDGFLTAVSCPTIAGCIAAGTSTLADPVLAARWNGSAWSVQPTPASLVPGTYNANGLSCATITQCLVVPAPLRLRPDGWTTSPNAYGGLQGVSCVSPTACVGVGSVSNGAPPTPSTQLPPRSSSATPDRSREHARRHAIAPGVALGSNQRPCQGALPPTVRLRKARLASHKSPDAGRALRHVDSTICLRRAVRDAPASRPS
jgi:hypothetical protein